MVVTPNKLRFETERLILRDFQASDWEQVLAYRSDSRYQVYYPPVDQLTEDTRSFVNKMIEWQGEQPRYRYQLAVVLKEEGILIGICGVRKESPIALQAEIGYELDPHYWGRGYAREAAHVIVDFAFRDLQLHRLHAHCLAENATSIRVLEKLGMTREGHLREHIWMKGRWWDTFLYGLLVYEWHAQEDKGLSF